MRGLCEHILIVLVKFHGLHNLGPDRARIDAGRHAHPKGATSGLPFVAHDTHQTHRSRQVRFESCDVACVTRHALGLKPRRSALGIGRQITPHGIPLPGPGSGLRNQSLGPQLPQRCAIRRRGVVDVANHKHGRAHLFQQRQQGSMASWPLEWCAILGCQPRPFLVQDRHVRGRVLHRKVELGVLRGRGGIFQVGFDFCHMILLHREPHLGRFHQASPTVHVGLKRRLCTCPTVVHVKRHQSLGDGAFFHEGQKHCGRVVG